MQMSANVLWTKLNRFLEAKPCLFCVISWGNSRKLPPVNEKRIESSKKNNYSCVTPGNSRVVYLVKTKWKVLNAAMSCICGCSNSSKNWQNPQRFDKVQNNNWYGEYIVGQNYFNQGWFRIFLVTKSFKIKIIHEDELFLVFWEIDGKIPTNWLTYNENGSSVTNGHAK